MSRRSAGAHSATGRRPLYDSVLRLRHLRLARWQRLLLAEGSVVVAVLVVLAELASPWLLLALPVAVAVLVKLHDVLAGLLADRPAGAPALATVAAPAPTVGDPADAPGAAPAPTVGDPADAPTVVMTAAPPTAATAVPATAAAATPASADALAGDPSAPMTSVREAAPPS